MTPKRASTAALPRRAALTLLAAAACPAVFAAPPAAAAAPDLALPSDSVYHLDVPLTDQLGRAAPLAAHRGHPVLVSMFYTSCQFVCPMLVEAMTDTEARLGAEERARLRMLLVSFDPERDTLEVLRRTADQRQLDARRWSLARTDAASVRRLAALLGIRYRLLPGGDYNHTTAVILLDAEGRIQGRTTQLGNADPAFVARVRTALRQAPG